jgi:hypothetical protein
MKIMNVCVFEILFKSYVKKREKEENIYEKFILKFAFMFF